MTIALYVIAGLEAISALMSVSSVGKPRKPMTGSTAAFIVTVNAALVTVLIIAAGQL